MRSQEFARLAGSTSRSRGAANGSNDSEISEVEGNFSHVVAPLLVMFILAFVLVFLQQQLEKQKLNEMVQEAKEQAKIAETEATTERSRREQIETTKVGEAYIAIERLKLEEALKQMLAEEEKALALDFFTDQNGELQNDVILALLHQGPKSNVLGAKRFSSGCVHAQEGYRSSDRRNAIMEAWYQESIDRSGVLEYLTAAGVTAPRLTDETNQFLLQRIAETVSNLNRKVRDFQEDARSTLLRFYEEHPEEIRDQAVTSRLAEYSRLVEDSISEDLSSETSRVEIDAALEAYLSALKVFVYNQFLKAGAPLLKSE